MYLTYSDPCNIGLPPKICIGLRFPVKTCTVSFACIQFAMLVERSAALWKRKDYETYGPTLGTSLVSFSFAIVFERATALWKRGKYDAYGPQLGYALVTISIIVSLASTFWAVQKVEFDQHSVYCSTATSQTADRVMLLCFLISGVNIITLVGIIALFIFNEFALSRREFDLQSSYQLRENAYVIRIMLPLSIFQAICYAIFSISSGLISLFRDKLSPVQHKTLYTTAYIIPYYTLVSPILIWFIIKWSQQIKAAKIKKLTSHCEDEKSVYFRAYKEMWKNGTVDKD
ncbi:hypothetical protein RB195_016791 [Necator americanus]|uniref:Integral membrane protein, C.elegans Sra family n=1 Tax=Necator americanus TaxID=51031 RepID=A0ABR1C268_NECAM